MKISNFLILFIISAPLFSQEFNANLYFERGNGQNDTLKVGYDPQASINIDEQYGEIDISDQPING